jgi:hypothetical protein
MLAYTINWLPNLYNCASESFEIKNMGVWHVQDLQI